MMKIDSREFRLPIDERDEIGDLALSPCFGMRHLSIPEAAKLITVDTWYSGRIDLKEVDDMGDATLNDPRLLEMLAEHIGVFEQRLYKAVCGGWLKANIVRDIDGNLVPNRTHIERDDLIQWLVHTGHDYDDVIAEWMETNDEASYCVSEMALAYRSLERKALRNSDGGHAALIHSLRVENESLKRRLEAVEKGGQERVDRPITTRQRRTLLTIISALCDYSAIKPNERGAAGQIAAMTDEIGASITAETIAGLLKEIPEALETRIK